MDEMLNLFFQATKNCNNFYISTYPLIKVI
jgi:hypothetical protein